ncbi:NAD(P)/FAD-dependent oxidoreductase [Idiomarina loihiensis]|uniref:FAD-binding protein n=1 Tax=Idiomarina loihiensis (strain ATCC BAA-735 / DSM 15497 / L2-TR) TaxID=283942 RepID=Q5QXF8_IDILO|nr:NAD(P)/FAD-dependent oxidoreductase [Idiomarina loihiensis]AAV80981.1 FAD-binding protein [Idiomarina loihiensis L2TR]AGM35005.1 FAD-binding protein [Idiomarina loihiensis GSL 199]
MEESIYDVVIIGAGPAGSTAAAMLANVGKSVLVVEKQEFPRFSIGESLLPQCMTFIEEAGLLDAVLDNAERLGFQYKEGAAFYHQGKKVNFDFRKKSSEGPGTTYQVKREHFDQLLAQGAAEKGAEIRHGVALEAIDFNDRNTVKLSLTGAAGTSEAKARFVLDASGFGRVLPRLLSLESPSDFPVRQAVFCHVKSELAGGNFDRSKILITVHPQNPEIWYWLIPFADGTASIGVVGATEYFAESDSEKEALWKLVADEPYLLEVLGEYQVSRAEQRITGYSANVNCLFGDRFALLGNAGEFLDPVFSSGVTIAMQSSSLAVPLVLKELNDEPQNWQKLYSDPLRVGITTFRTFVKGWYDTRFQDVIFYPHQQQQVKEMICSILAGYAWDTGNPYVRESERRLNVLAELCG